MEKEYRIVIMFFFVKEYRIVIMFFFVKEYGKRI